MRTYDSDPAHGAKGYAPVNGLHLYYEIHGSGYPLVLIHGGGSTINSSFGHAIDGLAAKNKVIAVEMQAHGRTADSDHPLSFEQDAAAIAGLLTYLGIDKTNVMGFSNGGSTTLHLAVHYPELVNRIVVASTFYDKAGAPPGFWEAMKNASFEEMPEGLKKEFLKVNPDTQALYRMYERDVARMQNFTEFTAEQIGSIRAPALIISGDKDVVRPEHLAEMKALIRDSRLAILPGGHGDYIGECTRPYDPQFVKSTVEMINDFLNKGAGPE